MTETSQTVAHSEVVRKLMDESCLKFRVFPGEILGPRRFKEFCKARVYFVKRLRKETGMSLSAIGRLLNRHHTSIIYMLKKEQA